uniref:uncharacterized protein LOC128928666 isoform X2 n=1 Tax=Callithrix jacchus TaxID=9483 RepID=UPI00159EA7BD|nr:uncharacterized protein LOC128928666 isoform X2 [Callithrix jacchus]
MRVWFRGQRTRKAAVWLFHRARIPHRPACRTSSQSAVWQFLPVPRKGLLFLWLDSCSQTSRGSAGEHGGRPDTCRPVSWSDVHGPLSRCHFLPRGSSILESETVIHPGSPLTRGQQRWREQRQNLNSRGPRKPSQVYPLLL